jgi:hypothetical protein
MRTTRPDEIGSAAVAAVHGKIFTQDPDRQGSAGGKLIRATNRLPEHA